MSLEFLQSILPPPENPREIPSEEEFDSAEQALSKLPSDYKGFIRCYGTGSIDGFIWIFSPSATRSHLNIVNQTKRQIDAFREIRHSELEANNYPLFPEPDGLLPFGISDNGDILLWRTTGAPDDWEIVIAASREPKFEEFHGNLTRFLSEVLRNSYRSTIFPPDFPSSMPKFLPSS